MTRTKRKRVMRAVVSRTHYGSGGGQAKMFVRLECGHTCVKKLSSWNDPRWCDDYPRAVCPECSKEAS